ncbi:hypothetical protein BDC45DRAFT_530751 [Circinella umbellata]|nr:hypothetical protein BDC45DRAFT_530751 [Circinella umbellata]
MLVNIVQYVWSKGKFLYSVVHFTAAMEKAVYVCLESGDSKLPTSSPPTPSPWMRLIILGYILIGTSTTVILQNFPFYLGGSEFYMNALCLYAAFCLDSKTVNEDLVADI